MLEQVKQNLNKRNELQQRGKSINAGLRLSKLLRKNTSAVPLPKPMMPQEKRAAKHISTKSTKMIKREEIQPAPNKLKRSLFASAVKLDKVLSPVHEIFDEAHLTERPGSLLANIPAILPMQEPKDAPFGERSDENARTQFSIRTTCDTPYKNRGRTDELLTTLPKLECSQINRVRKLQTD